MEGVGDPISHERLSRLVATILGETLWWEGAIHLLEEKEAIPVDKPPMVAARTCSSRGDTSRYWQDKRSVNDAPIPPRPVAYQPDNMLLGDEWVRASARRVDAWQIPFSENILKEELRRHFRLSHILEYNGSFDLEDHLCRFENVVILHQYTEKIKCRIFLTKLVGLTQ